MLHIRQFFGQAVETLGLDSLLTGKTSQTPTYESTVDWITDIHKQQWDSAFDMPYHFHPIRAAGIYQELCALKGVEVTDEEVFAVLLHDSKEDGDVEDKDFRERGYKERTIDMVGALSKPKGVDLPYEQIIGAIIDTGDEQFILGKLADNLDNISRQMTGRMAVSDPPRAWKLISKYKKSIPMLCEAAGIKLEDAMVIVDPGHRFEIGAFSFEN